MQTLQSQMNWYVRMRWVLVGVLSLFLASFYLLEYRPRTAQMRQLREEIAGKQRELAMKQGRARTLPAVALDVDKLRQRLARFDKKLPRQNEMPAFLSDISQIRRRCALDNGNCEPQAPKRSELFSEMPIRMSFEGRFPDLCSFLRETEDMQRLTRVRNLKIRTTDAKLGQVQVEMAMSIYFME